MGTTFTQITAPSVLLRRRAVAIVFDDDSRGKLFTGIEKCVQSLAVTIGPTGRNVVLEQATGPPKVINDGVSIARSLELCEPVENVVPFF